MRLVPGRARVFCTLREQFERCDLRTVAVYGAVLGRWIGRVATGICRRWSVVWRQSCSRIELRQAVEGSIGVTVIRPVLAEFTEIVVERTIFLHHEDNVIELRDPRWST